MGGRVGKWDPLLELFGHLCEGQGVASCCGQFDGEGNTLKPATDPGDSRSSASVRTKEGFARVARSTNNLTLSISSNAAPALVCGGGVARAETGERISPGMANDRGSWPAHSAKDRRGVPRSPLRRRRARVRSCRPRPTQDQRESGKSCSPMGTTPGCSLAPSERSTARARRSGRRSTRAQPRRFRRRTCRAFCRRDDEGETGLPHTAGTDEGDETL